MASIAINESLAPTDVVVLEGEVADTTVVSPNVFVISGDFEVG